jgi:hypothetical protein
LGEEAAEQISEAADAAVAAAVPSGVTKRKTLAKAEAEADAWQQQYGEMYRKRHEQPGLLPVALEPFTALADRRAQARLAGTAQPVTESELNAAAADMQAAPASTTEALAESAAAAAAAAAGAVTSTPHGSGSLVGRVQVMRNIAVDVDVTGFEAYLTCYADAFHVWGLRFVYVLSYSPGMTCL